MRADRALRSLAGLHLGDCFGERFFVRGSEAATLALIADRALPASLWTWTDDTAQAHVLTDHLLAFGEVRQDELAMGFVALRMGFVEPAAQLERLVAQEPRLVLGALLVALSSVGLAAAGALGLGAPHGVLVPCLALGLVGGCVVLFVDLP